MSMVGYVLGYVLPPFNVLRALYLLSPSSLELHPANQFSFLYKVWAIDMAKTFHLKKEQAASFMLISTVSLTRVKRLKSPRWYHSD